MSTINSSLRARFEAWCKENNLNTAVDPRDKDTYADIVVHRAWTAVVTAAALHEFNKENGQ